MTHIFVTVNQRNQDSALVNEDLLAIQKWADDWLVTFSPPKTESLIISTKPDKHLNPRVMINNETIKEVTSHKHLGITLSGGLGWSTHTDEIYVKAMKRLDIIQYFKFKLGRNQLERFYISYVLPILEYGDVLWSGACDYELAKLDRVHIRAMRIITGAT